MSPSQSEGKFSSRVDVYRHLINGGTIVCEFPGNEVTARVVDDTFCRLNKDGKWLPYPLSIGNHNIWSPA